ncbi:MAG TPA: (2Fe-2S)-binding protein [Acidothermaceae bacterium]|nr:(2Fe-2S)-binding protein [Acidothermaceae bacterium]
MAVPLTRTLSVNGTTQTVSVDDNTEQLLYVLRNQLGLNGPKFGCGVAQCGCCTVLVDGVIKRSCVTPMNTLTDGAEITTLDGLGSAGHPHPLQQAFIDEQAGQCAYCANSMIMGALGFIEGRVNAGNSAVPTEDEIKQFLSGESSASSYVYLCRCGSHPRIVRAIQHAAEEMVH